MRRVLALAAVLAFLPACRLLSPGYYRNVDVCVEALPILREGEAPPRPYRVVRLVSGKNDRQLAVRACRVRADAVINVARGRLLRGEAVQYR